MVKMINFVSYVFYHNKQKDMIVPLDGF
jgi:hypothetical protein